MSQMLPRAATATAATKALKPALMAGALIAIAAALPLMHGGGGAQNELGNVLAQGGLKGQTMFLLLATFLTAIGLPRQIPAFAAGYAFGPWYGTSPWWRRCWRAAWTSSGPAPSARISSAAASARCWAKWTAPSPASPSPPR
ncbi:MAG: hypothetical protein PHU07_06875 [Acidocella sp.]|nr:hypothetical protein [Acidocella sp.]